MRPRFEMTVAMSGFALFLVTSLPANAVTLTVDVGPLFTGNTTGTGTYYQAFRIEANSPANMSGYPAGVTSTGEGDVTTQINSAPLSGSEFSVNYNFTLPTAAGFYGVLQPLAYNYQPADVTYALYQGSTLKGEGLPLNVTGLSDLFFSSLIAGSYTLAINGLLNPSYPYYGEGGAFLSVQGSYTGTSVSAVPLPPTWEQILIGFAGVALYRRRQIKNQSVSA